MKIRTKILTLALVLIAGMSMVSCLGDDSTETKKVDGNCAITSVVLGNLNRTIYTKSAATGKDTSFIVTIGGATFAMCIDQQAMEIYNPDSLPLNTNASKVVFAAMSGDGNIFYRTASGRDTLYSGKDSIDFTEPRYFTCYSTDGNQSKTYRVSVNVHKSASETFAWSEINETNEAFAGVSEQKAFAVDGSILVLAVKDGKPVVISNGAEAPDAWTVTDMEGLNALVPGEVYVFNDNFYYVDGALKQSADGKVWSDVATNVALDKLFAIGKDEAYARGGDKLYTSVDMQNWQEEPMRDDASQLPVSNATSIWSTLSFNKNFSAIIAAGLNADGDAVVWKKTVDASGYNTDPWESYPLSDEVKYVYPCMAQPVMMNYDSKVYCLGKDGNKVSNFVVTSDGGRNWIEQGKDGYSHPYTNVEAESFSAVADQDDYIWIMFAPSGKVVKGRLNRLSYETNQTIFLKGKK